MSTALGQRGTGLYGYKKTMNEKAHGLGSFRIHLLGAPRPIGMQLVQPDGEVTAGRLGIAIAEASDSGGPCITCRGDVGISHAKGLEIGNLALPVGHGREITESRSLSQRHTPRDLRRNGLMTTIGSRIRHRRKELGIDRRDLAKAVGISYTTLADLETERSKSTTVLDRIADKLGVSTEWLRTGRPKREGKVNESLATRPVRLDPDMIAETAKALRLYFERQGIAFSIEDDPELFIQAYGWRVELPEVPTPQNHIDFGSRLAGLKPKGVSADERGTGVPDVGTSPAEAGQRRRRANTRGDI